jgi:hypothetical protein
MIKCFCTVNDDSFAYKYYCSSFEIIFRFISVSDSLPKSPQIKMVEVWLLFSLFQPLMDVVLQTYIYYLTNMSETSRWPTYSARRPTKVWTKNANK